MARAPARQAGYTLLELLVAVAIIGLLVTFAQTMFFRIQHQQRARDGMRNVMSILGEARNTALILGAAGGTRRVTFLTSGPEACPTEFSATGIDGEGGQAAVVIDMNAPVANPAPNAVGNSITYINKIRKMQLAELPAGTPVSPAWYQVSCATVNMTNVFRDNLRFEPTGTTWPASGNRYTLTFDARGFINNTTVQVPGVTLIESQGRRLAQRVLSLGSGYSCFEDQAVINLSTLASPPASPRCASN